MPCCLVFSLVILRFSAIRNLLSDSVSLFKFPLIRVMHLSIEIPTPPPTPGQGGGRWRIFMIFEGTVRPWGWGISQDLL